MRGSRLSLPSESREKQSALHLHFHTLMHDMKTTAEQHIGHVGALFIVKIGSLGRDGVWRSDEGERADGNRGCLEWWPASKWPTQSSVKRRSTQAVSITSLQAKQQRQFPVSEDDRSVTSQLKVYDRQWWQPGVENLSEKPNSHTHTHTHTLNHLSSHAPKENSQLLAYTHWKTNSMQMLVYLSTAAEQILRFCCLWALIIRKQQGIL